MRISTQKWILIGVILLSASSIGADRIERFVNYQSWPRLADANFGPYHRSQQSFILGFIVSPLALGLFLQFLLLFGRPQSVPLWIVWTLLGASVAGFVSTIAIQIPIHRQLDKGYSQELLSRLLKTDWIRKLADLVRLLGTIALLQRCLS